MKVRQTTDGNIIWRIGFACYKTKATLTHSEYASVVILDSAQQQMLRHSAAMLSS
jgi:hypothetical protein